MLTVGGFEKGTKRDLSRLVVTALERLELIEEVVNPYSAEPSYNNPNWIETTNPAEEAGKRNTGAEPLIYNKGSCESLLLEAGEPLSALTPPGDSRRGSDQEGQ